MQLGTRESPERPRYRSGKSGLASAQATDFGQIVKVGPTSGWRVSVNSRQEPALCRRRLRLEDNTLAGFAVHDHAHGCTEAQMADASVFVYGRLLAQPLPVDRTFPGIRIDCEVADLKSGEVLEEMAALRRCNAKISETRFDNDARAGNFVPLYGNAEPGIIRSPATTPISRYGRVSALSKPLKWATALATSWLRLRSKRCESTTTTSYKFSMRPLPSTLLLWQSNWRGSTSPTDKSW